jgi:glycosyltransferase involved in cell wall biosynthesis
MWNGKRVSVIFPAYNERENIVNAIMDFYATGVVDEIIVVDNNSTDGTAEEVQKTPARLVKETRQGFGYALMRGLREATGDYIIMAEPDGTFVGKDVFKLLAYADDFDMVCGTRTTKELIWARANMGLFLRWGNLFVAKLLEILYNGPSFSDCGCTMRLIRREALYKFIDRLTVGGSHFLPEMVILALKAGLKIIEIPVNYRPRVGVSKITGSFKGTLKTGLRMIGLILRYKFVRR